jgi:ethylbenzene dioxygenase ferredoxin component
MSENIRLCPIGRAAEGEPLEVSVPGLPPLAVYEVDGAYFVTDNICTHGNARLSDGYHNGFVIECPLHGGSFDVRNGAPKTAPCTVALRTYPVMIEDGWVAIAPPVGGG